MRQKNKAISAAVAAAFASGILAMGHSVTAQVVDRWIAPDVSGNASGSWNSAANWSGGIPLEPNAADVTEQDVSGTSTITLDANQAIGNITFGDSNTTSSGGWVLNTAIGVTSSSADLLTLNPQGYNLFNVNQLGAGSVATINAQMTDASAGNLELAKGGAGTLVLTGNNSTLTGATAINDGILELDFAHPWSPVSNILGDDGTVGGDAGSQHVNFQGGELLLNGGGLGALNIQNFSAGTALENGGSTIMFNQNNATNLALNLGALTRNLYATIDVSLPSAGTVAVSPGAGGGAYPAAAIGTNNSGLGGLLVDTNGTPFVTVNGGADWAIVSGGDIMPASSNGTFYTASGPGSLSGNADVTASNVLLSGNTSVSTIRFNDAAAGRIVDIGSATNTLTTAGILLTPSAGGSEVITDGNLAGSETGGGDTQIGVYSTTSSLTISAVVSGATAITKTGPGTLVLAANNTYTGETVINGGSVTLANNAVVGTPFAQAFPADVQIAPAFGDTATLNVNGGTLNSARTIIAGNDNNFAGGTGTLNQNGGTINSAQWFTVGGFGNGTFNMSGGTLNVNQVGYAVMEISVFGASNGTVNLSNNAQINIYNNADIVFGSVNTSGNGTFNQEGGHVTFYSDNGVTVGGGGGVLLGGGGVAPTAVDTYNLDAGILSTPSVSHAAGTAILNLNGGTLQAIESTGGFVGGLNQANVEQRGAVVDTNGFNVTIAQPLLHAANLGPIVDGGLTKNGVGTLVVSGASTYSGATTITAGTLQLPAAGVPVPIASYSFDSYTPGVLANGAVITNSGSGGTPMNGVVNTADWQLFGTGPASGATITASGTGPYAGSSKAVQFDGAGTSIDIPSKIIDQSGGANWTFSVWVQSLTPGAAAGSAIMSKNVASAGSDSWASGNTVYYLGSGTGGAPNVWDNTGYPTAVRFGDGFIQGTPPTTPATDGGWHMITYEDSGGTQSIYMDGVNTNLNVTGAYGTDLSSLTRLGINIDTFFAGDGNVDYAGNMADLNFYDVALNATQIGQLYSSNTVTSVGGGGQFLPVATAVNITASGARLNLNSENQTIGSLAGVAGSSVTLGTGTLTTGLDNTNTNFAGAITGTGGLVKMGNGTFTVSGVNGYGGGTTVTAGKLLVAVSGALPTGTLTVNGPGVVQLADNISAGTPLATSSVNITSLSLTGSGTLDIGNNRVIIDYTAGHDPIASIKQWIATGFADNDVAGSSPAIISTDIAADDAASGFSYGIGYADGADGAVAGLPAGEIEIMFTLLGDANLDGTVNTEDFTPLSTNLGQNGSWDQGDFNYDGTVNTEDFTPFSHNLSQTAVFAAAAGDLISANGLSLTNVPEPASLGLLVVGGLGILGRRRRRRQEVTA